LDHGESWTVDLMECRFGFQKKGDKKSSDNAKHEVAKRLEVGPQVIAGVTLLKVKERSWRSLGSSSRVRKSGESGVAHIEAPETRNHEAPFG
jgi:hypothetical protein